MGQPELTSLGRDVAALQDRAPGAKLDAVAFGSGRARLSEAARELRAKGPPVPTWRRRALVAASLAAAVVLVIVGARALRRPEPLRFAVNDETGSVGSWIASTPTAPRDVRFSDGSEVRLEPGARARVTSVDAEGAAIALEEGSLEVSVVHRARTRWEVRGGPYAIHVVGTRFLVRWDPAAGRFEVAMREGAVVLAGPVVGDARTVRAGERLTVTSTTLEVGTTETTTADGANAIPVVPTAPSAPAGEPPLGPPAAGEPPLAPPAAGEPPLAPPASSVVEAPAMPSGRHDRPPAPSPAASTPPSASASTSAPDEPSWRLHAREGRYKEALAAAEAQGFDSILNGGTAADLKLLADATRLSGSGRATQVLSTLRKRFAGTPDAARAAFLLGRMAQDQAGDHAHAKGWFIVYLAEAPGGEFAADAMGRLVEAADRTGDSDGAERAAERYLAAYPTGAHAAYARQVLARRAPSGPGSVWYYPR